MTVVLGNVVFNSLAERLPEPREFGGNKFVILGCRRFRSAFVRPRFGKIRSKSHSPFRLS